MAEQDDARVQEIGARLEAATPGPWQPWPDGTEESVESVSVGRFVCHLNSNMRQFREDATFIAHAREDVPYLLTRLAALTAERDAWQALAGDREARLQQAVRDTTTMTKAAHDRKKERDALAARLAAAEAALRRARLWLEGASETFSETMTCDGDNHDGCDSYCERYLDMERGIAEIDAALAAAGGEA